MSSSELSCAKKMSECEISPGSKKATTLTDLPDKCLIAIFKWIPLQNLDDIVELCPKWERLVQDHIPVEVHLTDIGFRVAMHYYIGHEVLPKYRIKVVHSRVLDERLPELKSPEEIQVVEFATHTESFTFESLVSKSVNLRELYFGYGSLAGHLLCELEFHLPNLKLLSIVDRELLGKNSKQNSTGISIVSGNISGFLKKSFPSLEELSVTTMASRKQTIDYAQDLLLFVQNHCGTLKKIKFCVNDQIKLAGDSEPNPIYANQFCLPPEQFDRDKLASVRLEDLELRLGADFFVGLEQWSHLLNHQTQLAHLALGLEKPLNPSTFISPIVHSCATLVSLQLGVEIFEENQNQRNPMDLSIFAECDKMKMLVLRGPICTNPDLARSPSPELLNVDKLPTSLTLLAIDNIYLESEQVSQITMGLFKMGMRLERLSLRNIGTEGDYGVKLNMLDSWITHQAFQEIIVKGVNEEGDSQLKDYEHLVKFGAKSPLKKCYFHAFYFPKFNEYRRPKA